MIKGFPLRPEPRLLRPIQLLLLLVALAGALGRDRPSGSGALCARYMERASIVVAPAEGAGGHPQHAAPPHDGWSMTESAYQCTHCPPSQCATMAQCTGDPSTQSFRSFALTLEDP